MADYDLVRDILDEQLVDLKGHSIGKADGIVLELRADAPPLVVAIEVGPTTLANRLHPRIGAWVEAFNRWMGFPYAGAVRLPFEGLEVGKTEITVPIDADDGPLFAWERWVRDHFTRHLPWSG